MSIVIKHIELIERIDQLVRMQATGTSAELASKLDISKSKLYRLFDIMKDLGAPIIYRIEIQSFVYVEEVQFNFGFTSCSLSQNELRSISRRYLLEKV